MTQPPRTPSPPHALPPRRRRLHALTRGTDSALNLLPVSQPSPGQASEPQDQLRFSGEAVGPRTLARNGRSRRRSRLLRRVWLTDVAGRATPRGRRPLRARVAACACAVARAPPERHRPPPSPWQPTVASPRETSPSVSLVGLCQPRPHLTEDPRGGEGGHRGAGGSGRAHSPVFTSVGFL